MGRLAGGLPGHAGEVSTEQRGDADQLAAAAEEVEAGRGPVAVSRLGRAGICGGVATAGGTGVSRGNGVVAA